LFHITKLGQHPHGFDPLFGSNVGPVVVRQLR
jgi:hypothetical protein